MTGAFVFLSGTASLGGAELSILRYLTSPERAADARLVCFEEGRLVDAVRASCEVTVLRSKPTPRRPVRSMRALWRALAQTPEDAIIVANGVSPAFWLSLMPRMRRRYVLYLRQEALPGSNSLLRRLVIRNISLPRFNGYIANSAWTLGTLPPRLLVRRPSDVAYPVSGIKARSSNDVPPTHHPIRILSLSRLNRWKGVHTILQALALLEERYPGPPAFSVTIAGDDHFENGDYVDELRELASGLRATVDFVGHVDDIDELLVSHDVLVTASVTPEPFGQVTVQGLANGTLVLGSNAGGTAEIISDGETGLLFEPGSAESLAALFDRVTSSPHDVGELRKRGLASAAPYLDDRTVTALDEALERLGRAIGR